MKTPVKTMIASMHIGYQVEFYKVENEYSTEYIVTYGQSVSNSDCFNTMWKEYLSSCQHCLACEGYLE